MAAVQYRRHHHDRLTVDKVAVDCARQLGNRDFEARMLRRLAFAHFDLGQWANADELFTRQLAICQALGEHRRAALATLNLGVVDNAAGRPAQAAAHLVQARTMLAGLGDLDPYNAARAGLELGRAMTGAGSYVAAGRELRDALSRMHQLGSLGGQAQAHHALAVLATATGRYTDARAHLEQALGLYERLGDPDAVEIRARLQAALEVYDQKGVPDAAGVQQLAGLVPPADGDPHRMA